ncbi:MAG TPA: arylsulfatase [Tepidisphaeraceae bacterium]
MKKFAQRFLYTAGICVFGLASAVRADEADHRPNVLIILADDMGYSDPSCFGGDVHTSNLDALAKDGVRFTSFYNEARCCPTRACLLTGLYAHQAGIGDMNEKTPLAAYSGAIKPTVPTIAEVLRDNGYDTAAFGKWHVANTLQRPQHMSDLNRLTFPKIFAPIEQYPTRRGFEIYWGGIWGVENYFNPFSLVDGETPVKTLPPGFYMTDAINNHATDYIQREAKSPHPFFIYLAENAPHWPLHALPEDLAKYRGQYNNGYDAVRHARYDRMIQMGIIDPKAAPLSPTVADGKWGRMNEQERRFAAGLFQAHAAMIDRMDQGLGRVFTAIKETGRWQNTLIIFLSDNGASDERYEEPGYDRATIAHDGKPIHYDYDLNRLAGDEHTWYYIGRDWANVANTPYRKWKASQYNGGERTPMIAHWPDGIKVAAGSFIRARGHVVDLMATILDLAKAKLPEEFAGEKPHALEGISLVPLLKGSTQIKNYPPLFGEHEGGRSVITRDGWKLIRDRDEKQWHLYDLNTDETEMTDLIDKEPARAKKMIAMWDDWAKRDQVLPKPR